jgi:hypothetical protein
MGGGKMLSKELRHCTQCKLFLTLSVLTTGRRWPVREMTFTNQERHGGATHLWHHKWSLEYVHMHYSCQLTHRSESVLPANAAICITTYDNILANMCANKQDLYNSRNRSSREKTVWLKEEAGGKERQKETKDGRNELAKENRGRKSFFTREKARNRSSHFWTYH